MEPKKYPLDIAGHWAEDVIKKYIDRGIVKGYPNGNIEPDRNITLAELLTILDRLGDANV